MPAGDGLKRVRVIEASVDETIEIRWWRQKADATGIVNEQLSTRHTAPPPASWDARLKEFDDRTDADPATP